MQLGKAPSDCATLLSKISPEFCSAYRVNPQIQEPLIRTKSSYLYQSQQSPRDASSREVVVKFTAWG